MLAVLLGFNSIWYVIWELLVLNPSPRAYTMTTLIFSMQVQVQSLCVVILVCDHGVSCKYEYESVGREAESLVRHDFVAFPHDGVHEPVQASERGDSGNGGGDLTGMAISI